MQKQQNLENPKFAPMALATLCRGRPAERGVLPVKTFGPGKRPDLCATFYLTYFLAFYLAKILALYATSCLTYCLAICLTYILASYLVFYWTYILASYVTYILTVYLTCTLGSYLTYILAFHLTHFDTGSGILSGGHMFRQSI